MNDVMVFTCCAFGESGEDFGRGGKRGVALRTLRKQGKRTSKQLLQHWNVNVVLFLICRSCAPPLVFSLLRRCRIGLHVRYFSYGTYPEFAAVRVWFGEGCAAVASRDLWAGRGKRFPLGLRALPPAAADTCKRASWT